MHCNIKMQFTEDEGRNLSISLGEEPSKQGNTSANCSTRTASTNGDRKSGPRALNWNPAGSAGPAGRPSRPHCAVIGPPVVSTTPPHPEASPDRPGAVTVSRIVARNSGHPEPYTGTRTVLVCSSRPRGSAAAAGGGTPPRNPPLR